MNKRFPAKINPLECFSCNENCENKYKSEMYYNSGYKIPIEYCKKYYRMKYKDKSFSVDNCRKCQRGCFSERVINYYLKYGFNIPYSWCKKFEEFCGVSKQ